MIMIVGRMDNIRERERGNATQVTVKIVEKGGMCVSYCVEEFVIFKI